MSDAGPVLVPHSLTEARLYLKMRSCKACGQGPLEPSEITPEYDAGRHRLTLSILCRQCDQQSRITFDTSDIERRASVPSVLGELRDVSRQQAAPVINPTRWPSLMIDVAGWLTLHTMLAEAARAEGIKSTRMDRRAAVRRVQVLAGQCLDEALKFFDEDNDLPPREAFFAKESYQRFLDRPELYTRQRLIELRGQFPR